MITFSLIDVAPDPVGIGVVLTVMIFVLACIVLLLAALVFLLWYRKRSLRGVEMIRADNDSAALGADIQPNSPNQL